MSIILNDSQETMTLKLCTNVSGLDNLK